MPQMSPIQWTFFLNMFLFILLSSSIIINFLMIINNKSLGFKNKTIKKINFKW